MDWLRALERTVPSGGDGCPDRNRSGKRQGARARSRAYAPRRRLREAGTCVGRYGTLTTYLIDAVNLVAENLDTPGGSVFSSMQPWDMANTLMGAVCGGRRRKRSRIGGIRSAIGSEPAALMAKEITTPGDRQIKAMFVSAGNPVLSVPNGDEFEAAFESLELSVALDFYVTETTARCDYILPVNNHVRARRLPVHLPGFSGHAVSSGHRGGGRTRGVRRARNGTSLTT